MSDPPPEVYLQVALKRWGCFLVVSLLVTDSGSLNTRDVFRMKNNQLLLFCIGF